MTPPWEDSEKFTTEKRLNKLAKSAKGFIAKAEGGCVDAYVKAGDELTTAKAIIRKDRTRKWGAWLEENGIPQRTASRAMRYCREPEKHRQDRIKDAFAKREKRKQKSQPSGRKGALLKALKEGTDAEIDTLYTLIFQTESLFRLHDMLAEQHPEPEVVKLQRGTGRHG